MPQKLSYEFLEKRIRDLENQIEVLKKNYGIGEQDDREFVQPFLRSDRQFQEIMDRAHAVVYVKDLAGRYIFINRHFENLSGYNRQQVLGRTDFDLFPLEVAENSLANDRNIIETKTPMEIEEFGPVDGEMHAFISAKFPVFDSEEQVYGICGISTDIQDRKRVEEALRDSEHRHKIIIQVISDYIFKLNIRPDRSIELSSVSENYREITGSSFEGAERADSWLRRIHPDDFNRVMEFLDKAILQQHSGEIECRSCINDKEMRWVSIAVYPEWNDIQMRTTAIYGSVKDITERKQAENELRRLRQMLGDIVNCMPSAIICLDTDGRITHWNTEAEKMTGIIAKDAQHALLSEIFPPLNREMEKVMLAIRTGTPQKETKVEMRFHEESRFADITVYPLIGNDMMGSVIRIDDVTERVRMEEMMVQTEKMISVGGLAAGMAHEINNPLSGILQCSQNILRRLSPEISKNLSVAEEYGIDLNKIRLYMKSRGIFDFLQGIRDSGERAARIVENMLQFSRRSEAIFRLVNIAELIDKAVLVASSDYDLKKRYDFRHIRILRDDDPDLSEIPCIRMEIEQVLLNLLKNSAQAMIPYAANTGIHPTIVLRTRKIGDMARIEVQDNGPGMDEKTRKRVFEPFFTTKEVGLGTGLGLSVSYFIITENHRGTISVESARDKGTTFIMNLPLKRGIEKNS